MVNVKTKIRSSLESINNSVPARWFWLKMAMMFLGPKSARMEVRHKEDRRLKMELMVKSDNSKRAYIIRRLKIGQTTRYKE